jgi:hypothetical protein
MTASDNIDAMIAGLGDWRGEALAALRKTVNDADPRLKEDWKWNTPVWTYKGNVCALGAFKDHVKVNFFKGAHLDDPRSLFNAGLEAKDSRSIDLHEGEQPHGAALAALVRAATDFNEA